MILILVHFLPIGVTELFIFYEEKWFRPSLALVDLRVELVLLTKQSLSTPGYSVRTKPIRLTSRFESTMYVSAKLR